MDRYSFLDHKGIAFAQVRQCLFQPRTFDLRAAELIREDALASGLVERVEMQFQILVPGRHPGVSNPHGLEVLPSASNSRYSYRRGRNEKNESRTVFENLKGAFSEHFTHTRFISRKVGFS